MPTAKAPVAIGNHTQKSGIISSTLTHIDNTYLWFIIPQLLNGHLLSACLYDSV